MTNKLLCSTRIYLRAASLLNTKALPKALNETESYLYADDTCIFCQDKDVELEKVFNKEVSSLFEWFIDDKLSIQFLDDKTNTILNSRMKRPSKLSISYGEYSLKQRSTVEYLEY